jgi:uncharacterized protein
MIFDDLSAPLGQRPARRRRELPVSVPKVIAAALALFLGAFVVWAVFADDPFGGEPRAAVPIDQPGLAAADKLGATPPSAPTAPGAAASVPPTQQAGPEPQQVIRPAPPPGTKTVTIIDGTTGARQEILIPAPGSGSPSASANSKAAK